MFLLILLAELPGDSSRVRITVLLLAGLLAFQQIVLRWPLDRYASTSIADGTSPSPYVTHLHYGYVSLEVTKPLGLMLLIKFQLQDFALQ